MERERRIFLQGLLAEKKQEIEALEVKCGRLQSELLRLIKPFEPLESQIKILDVEAIEQAVRELKKIKIQYQEKIEEIKRIEKEIES